MSDEHKLETILTVHEYDPTSGRVKVEFSPGFNARVGGKERVIEEYEFSIGDVRSMCPKANINGELKKGSDFPYDPDLARGAFENLNQSAKSASSKYAFKFYKTEKDPESGRGLKYKLQFDEAVEITRKGSTLRITELLLDREEIRGIGILNLEGQKNKDSKYLVSRKRLESYINWVDQQRKSRKKDGRSAEEKALAMIEGDEDGSEKSAGESYEIKDDEIIDPYPEDQEFDEKEPLMQAAVQGLGNKPGSKKEDKK